jgi:hypothetical protein
VFQTQDRRRAEHHEGQPADFGEGGVGVALGHRVVVTVVADQRGRLVHVADPRGAVVDGCGRDVHQAVDARVPRGTGQDRRALDGDPLLVLALGAHRVDGRHDGVRTLDDGCGEVGVEEVTDPLLDAGDRRGGAGTSYDGSHVGAALGERRAGAGTDEAIRSGDHDDG